MHEDLSTPATWTADTIRTLVVPQVAPPYDDEPERGNASRSVAVGWLPPGSDGAGHCPADATASREPPPVRTNASGEYDPGSYDRRLREDNRLPEHGSLPERSHGQPGGGPAAGAWPRQFAQILAETLAGSRPAHQLTPWTTQEARRRIRQLGQTLATGQRPLVRRVMTSAPASGVLELTAVVGFGPRVRVLAVRLERQHNGQGHWRCTAIESA